MVEDFEAFDNLGLGVVNRDTLLVYIVSRLCIEPGPGSLLAARVVCDSNGWVHAAYSDEL